MRVRDRDEEGVCRRADGSVVRRPQPTPVDAMLALQRGAGNQAVARVMASRRTLARACDEQDEANQIALHEAHTDAIIEQGEAMIQSRGGGRGHGAIELPSGGHDDVDLHISAESDDEGIYESDDDMVDDEMAEAPQPQVPPELDRLVFFAPAQKIVPLSVLLAHFPLEYLQQPGVVILPPQEGGHMMLHRTLARDRFKKDEPRPRQTPLDKVPRFTGHSHGDNPDLLAGVGVGDQSKVKRRGIQSGTATNSTTRPPGWWQFIPLIGFGKGLGRCTYVMGHLLNKDFGGYGHLMQNLSPFTSRLNAHHKTQVETPLRDFLKGAGKGHLRKIDYTVKANYGAPADVANDTRDRFDRFLTNNRKKALAAWVRLGIIAADDVDELEDADLTDDIDLTSGESWAAVVSDQRDAAMQYVNAHFPQSITCTAREYDLDQTVKKPAHWTKSATLIHTIPHVR